MRLSRLSAVFVKYRGQLTMRAVALSAPRRQNHVPVASSGGGGIFCVWSAFWRPGVAFLDYVTFSVLPPVLLTRHGPIRYPSQIPEQFTTPVGQPNYS